MSPSPGLYTETDKDFIRRIINAPGDTAPRLVYADWLEERGDDLGSRAAAFLRKTLELASGSDRARPRSGLEAEVNILSEALPEDWVAVLDLPDVENCDGPFKFRCPLKWDHLHTRRDPATRHCDVCSRDVHYCRSVDEAADHAWRGECVAIGTSTLRRFDDFQSRLQLWEQLMGPPPGSEVLEIGIIDESYIERRRVEGRRPWWKFW
jgi:uncharacterized protein (TIGR02996 family)